MKLSMHLSAFTLAIVLTALANAAQAEDRELTLKAPGMTIEVTYNPRSPDDLKASSKVGKTSHDIQVRSVDTYRDGGSIIVYLDGGATLFIPKDRSKPAEFKANREAPVQEFAVTEKPPVEKPEDLLPIFKEREYMRYIVGENADFKVIVTYPKRVQTSLDDQLRSYNPSAPRIPQHEVFMIKKGEKTVRSMKIADSDSYSDGGSIRVKLKDGSEFFVPWRADSQPMKYFAPGQRTPVELETELVVPNVLLGQSNVRVDFKGRGLRLPPFCHDLFTSR